VTNLDELIAQLRAAKKHADEAIGQIAAARAEVNTAEQEFRATVRGSRRPEAVATPERWEAARDHLDKVIGRLLTGGHAVDVYIDLLGGGASGTAVVGQPSPAAPAPLPEPEDHASRLKRLRKELVRKGDDVIDATHETVNHIRNLIPHGHGPTTTHMAAPATPPADQQPGVPDYATGLLASGIVAAETAAKVGQALRRLKEKHDKQHG
jgi:hypothetical protein